MSVNLQKGQKVDLTKGNSSLKNIIVGLGWDEADSGSKGILSGLFHHKQPIDCDASAILCNDNGKLANKDDIVYFGNLRHKSNSVMHMGDNLTGEGDGDDEQIMIQLKEVPQNITSIVIVVNIYQAKERKQDFSMISNAFVRVVDADSNVELCKYNLSDVIAGKTALIFGEVYKKDNEWKFNAIGEATNDSGLSDIVKKYQ